MSVARDHATQEIARSRIALLRLVTEDQFQDEIIAEAQLRGWRAHHARPARTERGWRTPIQGDPGFPDLVLARGGRLLIWELKKYGGRPTPGQVAWLAELALVPGVDARVVTPEDWDSIRGALA